MIAALAPGFQNIAMQGHLSTQVVSILDNTIRWTSCIEQGRGPNQSKIDQMFLLDFDPRSNSSQAMRICRVSSEKHAIEKAICKGLYIYHANILAWSHRCAGYLRIIEEMADTICSLEVEDAELRDFWSWLSLLIANAARRGCLYQAQVDVMAKYMALNKEGQAWESIQVNSKRFIWHSGLDREWKMCWEMAKKAETPTRSSAQQASVPERSVTPTKKRLSGSMDPSP